jgi:hypothetical protein
MLIEYSGVVSSFKLGLRTAVRLACLFALALEAQAAGFADYVGNWQFEFSGGDSGRGKAVVDERGAIRGDGFSNVSRSTVSVSGSITRDGEMQFSAAPSGVTSLQSTFVGQAKPSGIASGSWSNPSAQLSGKWTAKRGPDEPPGATPNPAQPR